MSQFSLIAQDGNEYGPVSMEALGRWRAENRLNEYSLLRRESDGLKMQAGKFPELESLFQVVESPIPTPPSGKPAKDPGPRVIPSEVPMSSSLFLLLCSASLSFLVLTLPALVAGWLAWKTVHEAVELSGAGATDLYQAKLKTASTQLRAGWIMLVAGVVLCLAYMVYLQIIRA